MASWERDHTTDPVLQQLAADIEATQTSQIGRMQGWLELWGAAALPVGGHMAWMTDAGRTTTPAAPAAASPRCRGWRAPRSSPRCAPPPAEQLDVLFLQLMLRHHEGGAGMLEYAAERAAVPAGAQPGRADAQLPDRESDYLRQLLAERGGKPLPL